MNIKELRILVPNIWTIGDTIDLLHKINNNGTSPSILADNISDRYWIINNTDNPNNFSLFTTDILSSDIKYDDEIKLYESLKKKYNNNIINKFVHDTFDFGEKFINIISTIIEKEHLDQLNITIYNDDTDLNKSILNLLTHNNKWTTEEYKQNEYMNTIIIHNPINYTNTLEVSI